LPMPVSRSTAAMESVMCEWSSREFIKEIPAGEYGECFCPRQFFNIKP
jgi:hypothetical protein